MTEPAPEFSRLVPLTRVGATPLRQEISATAEERAALAGRFGLVALDRLDATVELERERRGTILLRAEFAADFTQECIVTLDPVADTLNERFALRFGPPEAEPGEIGGDDEPAFQPLDGEAIDIGEAVAQEFSLALPPFPRCPDAAVEETAVEPDASDEPFAALGRLLRRPGN